MIDASIVTGQKELYVDIDIDHGPSYGETLFWEPRTELPPYERKCRRYSSMWTRQTVRSLHQVDDPATTTDALVSALRSRQHGLPGLITKTEIRFLDVDLDRGAGYGSILSWSDQDKPKINVQPVEIGVDLDTERFYKMFVDLLTAPTPPKP